MTAANIIQELKHLPLADKLLVVEQTIKSIRTEKEKHLKLAVEQLYGDYRFDKELTVFTELDKESFYEAR